MSDSGLYRKPFFTAAVFLVIGSGMIAGGFVLAESTGSMGYYAFIAFGVLALITSAVVFLMYRRLEREFRNALGGDPLLRFTVDSRLLAENTQRNIEEIKSGNKAKLFIMLIFCALVAIVFPFFFEDGYLFLYIGIGMAVFLTLSALIITAYRIRKLHRGNNEFILSPNGAYVSGEFHSWNMPGTMLTGVWYRPPAEEAPGLIEIEYTAASYPAAASQKISLPIPKSLASQVVEMVRILQQRQRGN